MLFGVNLNSLVLSLKACGKCGNVWVKNNSRLANRNSKTEDFEANIKRLGLISFCMAMRDDSTMNTITTKHHNRGNRKHRICRIYPCISYKSPLLKTSHCFRLSKFIAAITCIYCIFVNKKNITEWTISYDQKALLGEIKQLIEQSRHKVAIAVNSEISMLYWHVGNHINNEVLDNKRAEYGKNVIPTLSQQLTTEYGKGWSERHLWSCLKFAQAYTDLPILHTLCAELSWSHIRLIINVEDKLKRDFYIQMAKHEHWSVRTLKERMRSMLYERTAISKKPEETVKNDLSILKNEEKLSPDLVFKDPYFLDFLGLKDNYSEKDLESSILAELQNFIIELGSDFAFLARQKRITIDNTDYYIDLLFYHRELKCLVVIELKIGEFEAAHKGQMELYLRYLEKYEQKQDENPPIGLILCTGKNQEHVELLQLHKSNIKVADYLTALPPQKLLKEKLHKAIEIARQKIK